MSLWDERGDTREVVAVMEASVEIPSRLAALEQRVGALVEALCAEVAPFPDAISVPEFRTRLAALRAPDPFRAQVERDHIVDGLRAQLAEVTRERDALRRAVGEANGERDTARRERDEAMAVVRDLADWESSKRIISLDAVTKRARALVAGQGVAPATHPVCDICGTVGAKGSPIGPPLNGWICDGCDKECPSQSDLAASDAEIAGLKREVDTLGDHVRAHFRDKERALDELSQARIEVETIQSKLAGAEHAIADLTTTFGTVESERDTLRARIAELEARDREGRWIVEHPRDTLEYSRRVERYLDDAPIPDPARGLIERAAKVLETYVPLSEDELIADLRAYLGGGA